MKLAAVVVFDRIPGRIAADDFVVIQSGGRQSRQLNFVTQRQIGKVGRLAEEFRFTILDERIRWLRRIPRHDRALVSCLQITIGNDGDDDVNHRC